jgi:hypothetical protein
MIFDADGRRTANHAAESIGLFLMGGCLHEFSWPRRAADGRYYQVCILCNLKREYDWQSMRRIEPESAAPEGVTPNPSAQLKLLLEMEPATRVFFRNLFDLLLFRSTSRIPTTSRQAPFWSDVFVYARVPWWRFAESMVCHVLTIAAVLIGSRAWTQLEQPQPLRISRKDYVTYYTPSQSFPAMKARIAPRTASRGGSKSLHHAGIRVAAGRVHKALTAPNIKLAAFAPPNLAVPNAIAPAAPAAANTFNRRPQLTLPAGWTSAIAPPPDVNQAGSGRSHSYQISVIAPAPGVDGISSQRGLAVPGAVVVSPLPSLQGSMRNLGDVNIGHARVVQPAPRLPVDEQHAGLGMALAGLSELTGSIVSPLPLVRGYETLGAGRAGPVSNTGLQVVEPAPSLSTQERHALGMSRGSLGGGLTASVVSPPPSVQGDGTLGNGRTGPVSRDGVQVVGPAPSMSGQEQAAMGMGRASLGGNAADSVVPPAPSIQGEGTFGNGRGGSATGSGSQVVPPAPAVQDTYASATLGRPTAMDLRSTVATPPRPLIDDRRPIQELQLRLVALASATPGSSYFSNYEVFIAERRIGKDESQLIKLVYVSLPYQRRLSQYAVDNSRVYKLRVTRDLTCDESLLQMTWPDTDSHSSSERNSMLPCYRTTADDYRRAVGH